MRERRRLRRLDVLLRRHFVHPGHVPLLHPARARERGLPPRQLRLGAVVARQTAPVADGLAEPGRKLSERLAPPRLATDVGVRVLGQLPRHGFDEAPEHRERRGIVEASAQGSEYQVPEAVAEIVGCSALAARARPAPAVTGPEGPVMPKRDSGERLASAIPARLP